MLKIHEIQAIEKHIEKTRLGGDKVGETAYSVLKEFLIERLLACISSPDPKVRRAAVRVSGKFAGLNKDHQMRVIYSMSNKM